MPYAMFSRNVAFELEKSNNDFVLCRALSIRARDINMSRKSRDVEAIPADEPNSSASSMIDLAQARITYFATAPEE